MMRNHRPGENVLIIGSGIGGLTTAIILSKLHYRVTVVEKNKFAGGLMRSYMCCGIDCPVGMHYTGSLDNGQPHKRLWDYLGVTQLIPLERLGENGVIDRYIFDDFHFDLPEGIDAYEDNLKKTFPHDHRQIDLIIKDLRQASRTISSLDMLSSSASSWSPDSFASTGQYLKRMGCSPGLQAVLGVPATLIGVPLNVCPLFYFQMILASYLMSSWRLADSGARMADAFASRVTALGGNIITGDGAEKILVEAKQVKGAVLQSGRVIATTAVIAAVHPRIVVAMLPADALRPAYVERVSRLEDTKGIFAVNLALDAEAHQALPYNIYRLYAGDDGILTGGAFFQLRQSRQPKTSILSILTESSIDEWRRWESTTSGRRGREYEKAKEDRAQRLIDEAVNIFGYLNGMKPLDSFTPLTIRDRTNSPFGSAYGVMRSTGQLMQMATLKRTAVAGLFPAGQSIMAPGIMGTMMGSFLTVKNIIGPERFAAEVMRNL